MKSPPPALRGKTCSSIPSLAKLKIVRLGAATNTIRQMANTAFQSRGSGLTPYSAIATPEPPNSLGKSLSLGRPSLIGSTVSA